MLIFDQSQTNALATGDSHTRLITVSTNGQAYPLRITLVWTDPPGNPAAGVKLVNDLDLVVTNLDTGDVFFGNDIQAGSYYNYPWDTNTPPNIDSVNNVENIFIPPQLNTNYSVTVIGHRVNVNAVTAHTNNVVQDYALVISSGNGEYTNALTLTSDTPTIPVIAPFVTMVTNTFDTTANASNRVAGALLLNQRVGADTPLWGTNTIALTNVVSDAMSEQVTLGMTNQWHFYVITNTTSFTNAAFLTFIPENLAIPRIGVFEETDPANATRSDPDIDLYVAGTGTVTDSGLTNLDPNVISNCANNIGDDQSSQGRGGTEVIVYNDSTLGQVYYIGVKLEDQMAAEYGFLGVFSENPFSQNRKRQSNRARHSRADLDSGRRSGESRRGVHIRDRGSNHQCAAGGCDDHHNPSKLWRSAGHPDPRFQICRPQ